MSHAPIKLSAYRVCFFSKWGKLKVRQHRKGLFWPLTGRNYYKKSRSHGICPMAHWHGMCTLIEFFGSPAPLEHPSNIWGCPTSPRRSQNHPLTAGMRPVKKSWQRTHWWESWAWTERCEGTGAVGLHSGRTTKSVQGAMDVEAGHTASILDPLVLLEILPTS